MNIIKKDSPWPLFQRPWGWKTNIIVAFGVTLVMLAVFGLVDKAQAAEPQSGPNICRLENPDRPCWVTSPTDLAGRP